MGARIKLSPRIALDPVGASRARRYSINMCSSAGGPVAH